MNLKEVILKCNGTILNTDSSIPETFHRIKTDTRELEKGDIFVALKGKNYDGHQYIEEAIQKGASAVIVEEEITSTNIPVIKVADTYQALFDLAHLYLETYPVFVVAITGSVGKTTTKELIATVLEKKYRVLKSKGNKNNRIGIPQTIFELNKNIECLVVELGMNHFHEIDQLSDLVKPNIAAITNIGSAHIGNLGSKKNILKAKMEILSGMEGGLLVLNNHDKYLKKVKKIKNGMVKQVNWKNGTIEIDILEQTIFGSKLKIKNGIEEAIITFPNPGLFVLDDIALALHIGEILEVPFSNMLEALKEYTGIEGRFTIETIANESILINDCYNSSYESLIMDLNLLKQQEGKKVLILGDILELGKNSKKIHKKIGEKIRNMEDCEIYFIGAEMKYAWKKSRKGIHFNSIEDCIENCENDFLNCMIFLKGSRRMQLEKIVSYVKSKVDMVEKKG